MAKEKPLLHSIVMCDYVYRDFVSNKHCLLGTFSSIQAASFPTPLPALGIYVAVSHWVYDQEFSLQIVKDEVELLTKLPPVKIPKRDPNHKVELGINLEKGVVNLPAPGRYSIQVLVDKEIIHDFPIQVSINDAKGGANP